MFGDIWPQPGNPQGFRAQRFVFSVSCLGFGVEGLGERV